MNPKLDLLLERTIDVPREHVWKAWTTPDQILKWFTPRPWSTVDCTIDLRPGGLFSFVMRSPEGQEFPYEGCYLEVVENERLIWTTVLGPDFRPHGSSEVGKEGISFTAVISMESAGAGTKYSALVMHPDEATRNKHDELGFQVGWGAALDQLVEMIKG